MEDIKLTQKLVNKTLLHSIKEIIFNFLVGICFRGVFLLIPVILGLLIDKITEGNYDMAFKLAIVGLSLAFLGQLLTVFKTFSWHVLYNRMYKYLTKESLTKTYNNSIYSLSRFNSSQFINIMSNDINLICDFICNTVLRIIYIVEIIAILIYFFFLNIFIGLIALFVFILVYFIIFFSRKTAERLNVTKLTKLDERNGVVNELLTCMREIKSFNLFSSSLNRFKKVNNNYTEIVVEQKDQESLVKDVILLLVNIQRWILLLVGIFLIVNGHIALGTLVIIYDYHAELLSSYTELAIFFQSLRVYKVSALRLSRLLIYSHEKEVLNLSDNLDLNGDLVFENIIHGYKKNPLLNKVNITFKRGFITGITGSEGSGKSAIFDLILKLNQQHEGDILLNGIDINKIPSSDYFYLTSTIGKEPIFLSLSIRENLCANNENFEKIIDICKKLKIHQEIMNLENGYDSNLNDCRNKLSVSTKTMLIFARILSVNSKIILIDESFVHLDKKEKEVILTKLENLKLNKIIIIISNEKEVLKYCDTVVTLDNGIVLKGGDSNGC